MNFKVMVLVALIAMVFISFVLFGYVVYDIHNNTTETGVQIYEKSKWFCFAKLGIDLTALVMAGFLFVKR